MIIVLYEKKEEETKINHETPFCEELFSFTERGK